MADKLSVEEYNNTREGRERFRAVQELQEQINDILADVRSATEPKAFGSYVEWDDSGFFDNTDI